MNDASAPNPRLVRPGNAGSARRRLAYRVAAVAALFVALAVAIGWYVANERSRGVEGDATPDTADRPPAASVNAGSGSSGYDVAAADAYDGWASEEFAELAGDQLHRLGDAIAASFGHELPNYDGVASKDVRCTSLRPPGVDEVYRDTVLVVSRGAKSSSATPDLLGLDGLRDAVGALTEHWKGAKDVHYKFKLFGVDLSDARRPLTRQYFALHGHTDDGAFEVNATWAIGWQWNGDANAPTISSITVEEYEQVDAELGGGRLFSDCTGAVLGNEEFATDQFAVGVDRWRRRIEATLDVGLFGNVGLAVGDANGDGLDDVYRCQPGGLPNRLLLQTLQGTAVEGARDAGIDFLDRTRAALFVDLDNDGDQDLVLSLTREVVLLENDGRGHFSVRQRVASSHGFSLAAADYDGDADLDVYVCVYYASGDEASDIPVPVPQFDANNGGKNRLLENRGDWRFVDVTDERGLDDNNRRFSYAAAWEDVDEDGDVDLFVVNDFGHGNLYLNETGTFRDVATLAGLDNGAFGMSASFGDYDRDGRADIYQGNMFSAAGSRVTRQPQFMPAAGDDVRRRFQQLARGNTLFRNQGDGTYRDVAETAGVTMGRWSWGSIFADINNDGWDDLLVANGFVTGEDTDDL